MSRRSDVFVKAWVSENVRNDGDDYTSEIAALVHQMSSDAEAAGIEEDELEESVGDVDDFLTKAFEEVLNGEGSDDSDDA
jgi:hypothetical protein